MRFRSLTLAEEASTSVTSALSCHQMRGGDSADPEACRSSFKPQLSHWLTDIGLIFLPSDPWSPVL